MFRKVLPAAAALMLAALLLSVCVAAFAEPGVSLTEAQWSWNTEENASFICTVSAKGGTLPEGTTVELYAEDLAGQQIGEPVFVKDNGKKISMVKQSVKRDVVMPDGGGDRVLECVWHPPDEIGNTHTITLRAELRNAAGEVIALGETSLSDGVEASAYDVVAAGAERTPVLIPAAAGALAVIVWALAIIRSVRLRKKC